MKKKILHTLAVAAVLVPMSAYAADAPENLYIKGWTVNGTSWQDIAQTAKSEDGKTFYFKVKLTDGKTFKFYDGVTEIGPGGTEGSGNDKEIFCDNTYTMSAGGAAYTLNYNREDGAFSITVDYNGDSPRVRITPGHEKYPEIEEWKAPDPIVPGEMPESLNLIGLVGSGDWGTPGNYVSCTAVDKEAGTITFTNAEITGSFAFCNVVSETTTADQCKNHDGFYGPSGNDKDAEGSGKQNEMFSKSGKGFTLGSVGGAGLYDIVVYFPEEGHPYFTITRTGDIAKKYYFIGDMNDWFSDEFSNAVYVQDANGIYVERQYENGDKYYEICQPDRDQNLTKYRLANQANWGLKTAENLAKWQFKHIGEKEVNGVTADWYYFNGCPNNLLTGQFQIFDGSDWDGDTYSHAQRITNGKNGTDPSWDEYSRYAEATITREQIYSGDVMTNGQYDETWEDGNLKTQLLKIYNEDGSRNNSMIKKGKGQNFHLACNAVDGAEIYFSPGENPKLIIMGNPVDFYMFYGMNPDKAGADAIENGTDNVRAVINPGKPNTNNYFLPGIWYGQYSSNNEKTPLPNVPDGKDHMNLNGQNLVKIDWTKMSVNQLFEIEDGNGNPLFYNYPITSKLLSDIVNEHELPNDMSLEDYPEIWVQKIPNGFCNPAGRKFTLSFSESLNAQDREPVFTITANHMYFFSMENAHVHVNADELMKIVDLFKANLEISYRVFGQDAMWNTVVLAPDHNSVQTKVIYDRRSTPKATADEKADSDAVTYGWVTLNSDSDCGNWNCDHRYHTGSNCNWQYRSLANRNDAGAVNALAEDAANDDRQGVASRYSYKYVQFRLHYSPSDQEGAVAFEPFDTYFPEAPRAVADNQKYNMGGHDYYLMLNSDNLPTAIRDIIDDMLPSEDMAGAEDAEPVYYNLQGVRVENPTRGLYIKVTGSKSEKVMF